MKNPLTPAGIKPATFRFVAVPSPLSYHDPQTLTYIIHYEKEQLGMLESFFIDSGAYPLPM